MFVVAWNRGGLQREDGAMPNQALPRMGHVKKEQNSDVTVESMRGTSSLCLAAICQTGSRQGSAR